MFGWEFPPYNSGGLGTACLGLSRALARDHRVIFVLPRTISVGSVDVHFRFADEHYPNLAVREIDSPLTPYLTERSYRKRAKRGGYSEKGIYGATLVEEVELYAKRAREVAQNEEFDVIHAHDWLSFGAGIEAKRVSGKPLVVHVHATEYDRTGGNGANPRVLDIETRGMQAADTVIAVSAYTRRLIIEKYGIDPDKVTVVHNGIESHSDFPSEDKRSASPLQTLKRTGNKVVLFVGRVTLQKGPDYFIRAAKRVLDYYPNVVFVIAGNGDMEGVVMEEAAALGISDKVLFAGFVRGEDLQAVYHSADLYVMSSVSEPFGLTALEAVENGTPVLLSKQSGACEVLRHSLRADFWDIDEMANKMAAALFHESIGRELKKNAFLELTRLSWKKAAEKCSRTYRSLLGKTEKINSV